MGNFQRLLCAGVVAGVLSAAGCAARGSTTRGPSDYGELTARSAPPAPIDPYFETKPGQVWVHGRWARIDDQWKWQEGYWEPTRPGQVYINGQWDYREGKYTWTHGSWTAERPGYTYIPGYWKFHGSAFVWVRGRWERDRPGEIWVHGRWEGEGDQREWQEGHWAPRSGAAPEAAPAAEAAKNDTKKKR